MTMRNIIQWDLTYASFQVSQKFPQGKLLNYLKANVVCYNALYQEFSEHMSVELKFMNNHCKRRIQCAICC
jgi:hypothetical protein